MWWKWTITSIPGAYHLGAESFAKMSYALDAAMHAALFKTTDVIEIKIIPSS